jgi:hypothetical protein
MAHLVLDLSGFVLVQQAAVMDCLSFDPFSLQQDYRGT